jgi:uncharacterized protein (DUF433 family)
VNARGENVMLLDDMIGRGTGLYTLNEVARYARMSPITVARWFKGDDYCKNVFPLEDTKIITFVDFVQVLAVRNLRVFYKVKLQKIREAIKRADGDFGIQYPFARKHTTFLFDGDIWIKPEGKSLTQVSGKLHGQKGLVKVIERFYKDISFDSRLGLATEYKAYESRGNKIIMNPVFRFGEPMLAGLGYTPEALFEAAKTEGSSSAAAKSYGVTKAQVETSIDYFDYLLAA